MIQNLAFKLFVLLTQVVIYAKDTYAKIVEEFKEPKTYYFFGQQIVDGELISDDVKKRATYSFDTKENLFSRLRETAQVELPHHVTKLLWLGAELKTPDGIVIDISEWIKGLKLRTSQLNTYHIYMMHQYSTGQFIEPDTILTVVSDSADIETYTFSDELKI